MTANLLTNDSSFVQMVILSDDRRKASLTRDEASEIQEYIFHQIFTVSGKLPRFKGKYVFSKDDGAIIINTHVDSVSWLKEVVASYEEEALTITDISNCPQYTAKVRTKMTVFNTKVLDNLLDLLEAHNFGLKTNGWRISSLGNDGYVVRNVILLIDDPGMKMLEENGFKLFVGFSTLTFKLLGRFNRSVTTSKICDDDSESEDD